MSSVHFISVVQSCLTLCNPMDRSMPSFPVHHQLPELAQTHVHQVSQCYITNLILCSPLLLPSIFPSIRVFSNELVFLIRCPKVLELQLQLQSFQYSGLISFRMDSLDFHAVQGTLKTLLQHHHSKATVLQCSAFFPTLTSIHDYWKNHSFD